MKLSEEEFDAYQRRRKKERIMMMLFTRDSSFPEELAKLTGEAVDEVEGLIKELLSDNLVEHIQANYYKLTYEGYSWAKSQTTKRW